MNLCSLDMLFVRCTQIKAAGVHAESDKKDLSKLSSELKVKKALKQTSIWTVYRPHCDEVKPMSCIVTFMTGIVTLPHG